MKVVELAHGLRRRSALVRAVTTDATTGIVHPWAVEFATDDDAVAEITGRVEHADLCDRDGWAGVSLIAPATANTVGKIAAAIDDSPVTTAATTALGAGVLVVVTPAMHEPMYDHPGVLDAIERVWSWSVGFVDPRIKEGKTKVATEEAIVTGVAKTTTDRTLVGASVAITAGAVTESIDLICTLLNRASGRTGRVIARVLAIHGTDVILVHGGDDAHYADMLAVGSATEILDTVEAAVDTDVDALVSAATISDFTVRTTDQKIRSDETRTLNLEPAPKLADTVRKLHPGPPIVGFRAETTGGNEAVAGEVHRIMDRVDPALVVTNDASVMGDSEAHALVVHADETSEYVGSKDELSTRIAAKLATELEE